MRRGGLWAKHMGLKPGAIGNLGNMLGTKKKMTPTQKQQQQHDRQRQQRRRPRKHELRNRQHEECVCVPLTQMQPTTGELCGEGENK